MHLYTLPLIFVLIGLALYVVLAGADFGAALWQLGAGSVAAGARLRDFAHEAMAPVWEANHVWLIFVITVLWTAYPTAFGSIATTLSTPLFIALLGILIRGAAYALRAGTSSARELRLIDAASSASSLLSPFALGTVIGAIAARRVPVGNAAGNLLTSWLNPTSLLIGVLAVATCAYLAAVYLAADSARHDHPELVGPFRVRALAAGTIAGGLALGGLAVVHFDDHPLARHLEHGPGLGAVVVSALAGIVTLLLVSRRRFEPARYTAALAVAAIIGGGLLLFPSLTLLFRLTLGGQLRHGAGRGAPAAGQGTVLVAARSGMRARLAVALLLCGFGFLTVANSGWAHAIGIVSLIGFVIVAFVAVAPAQIAARDPEEQDGS